MTFNLNVQSSLLSIWDFHVPRAANFFPQQNFASQVLFSISLRTNNRPLGNWKQDVCTILWENILHYGEHESCRWGFLLRVNPLINWVLGDGSFGIFACFHFVQRMSITPHQTSATESSIQRLSQKQSLLLPWHKCLACSTSRGITSRTTASCVQTAFRVSRTHWWLIGVDWGSSMSVSIAVLSSGEEYIIMSGPV